MEDNSMYRDLFFEESDTHLESLNEGVLQLEQSPDDMELLNAIFRSAHTLKGMAGTMGYDAMAKLTHKMEDVFDLFKRGVIEVESHAISLVFDCLDTLSDIVENLRSDGDGNVEVSGLIDRLNQISNGNTEEVVKSEAVKTKPSFGHLLPTLDDSDKETIASALEADFKVYTIWTTVEEDSPMKGIRAFFTINKMEELETEILLSEPSTEELEEGEFDQSFGLLVLSKHSAEDLKKEIEGLNEIEESVVYEWSREHLEEGAFDQEKAQVVEENVSKSVEIESAKKTTVNKRKETQTIRVPLERLDDLMNRVSELVIHRTRLEDISVNLDHKEIGEPLEQVAKISSQLQEIVLQLRMQPFSAVVQRFPRMIRDLSKDLGKEFDYVLEGEDTELDRTIVSEIGDPLIHLLRNAADHGIETPEERIKAGKDPKGTIKVTAYPEGNRVVIVISDDGKGLNPVGIKDSAERKGISTDGLSDQEIQELIFHPGFSTTSEVTSISGRGVGMDVVKQTINQLNGTIETISEVGIGSTFRITLPLTLSIIQSLIVAVEDQKFSIPQSMIEKVENFEEDRVKQVHNQEVYLYKDQFIPMISVSEALGIEKTLNRTQTYVIFVLLGDRYHALLVDGIIGQRETVIKELGKELNMMKRYIGATILGSGDIILILDVSAICEEHMRPGVGV